MKTEGPPNPSDEPGAPPSRQRVWMFIAAGTALALPVGGAPHMGFIRIALADAEHRRHTQREIADMTRKLLADKYPRVELLQWPGGLVAIERNHMQRVTEVYMQTEGRDVGSAAAELERGTEANQPLALAVVGGLLSSTVLSLFLVPSIFMFLARRSEGPEAATTPQPVEESV